MTVGVFVALAVAGGLGMYFAIGGLLELAFYRRRADAARWKCQPRRWPSAKARRAEILLGTANLTAASVGSGLLAFHIASPGNTTAVYFGLGEHGVAFSIATTVLYFLLTDGALYGAHRLFHRKALFKAIHRVHHRWTSPTAFTAHAMHPIEFAVYQGIMVVPLFVLPIHVAGLIAVLVYQNLIALLDHSGVDMASRLPWQPPPRFHDDHHAHFHVNYGQTLGLWDRLFGTWRRVGRVYGAEVFGGKGAPLAADDGGAARYVDYRQRRADAAPAAGMDTAP